jgi:hypothetical protein
MGLGSIGTHQALVSSSRNFLVRRGTAVRPKMETHILKSCQKMLRFNFKRTVSNNEVAPLPLPYCLIILAIKLGQSNGTIGG